MITRGALPAPASVSPASRIRRAARIGFVLVGLSVAAGCTSGVHVTKNDMVGTYTVDYHDNSGAVVASERLVLEANGRYVQTFTPARGRPWTHTSTWDVDSGNGRSLLVLYDHWEGFDGWTSKVYAHPKKWGAGHMEIVQRGGVICITVDADTDEYFCRSR